MFTIKITNVEQVNVVSREYEKIADSGNKEDGGVIYGYVEYPGKDEVVTTILKQTVDTLHLSEIIKAINDL